MPKKTKKIITVETVEEPEKKTIAEKVEDFVASIGACGHQNKHYTDGDLFCTLDQGHKGDHSAELDGRQTFWSDAAGTPVHRHK